MPRRRPRKESKAKFREKIFGPSTTGKELITHMEPLEDRMELVQALDGHSDPRVQQLADMSADPAFGSKSVASIARTLGLSSKHIADAYRDGQIAKGIVRSLKHLPEVMEDVAIDAKSKWRMCKTCRGTGVYVDPDLLDMQEDDAEGEREGNTIVKSDCIDCGATGRVRIVGDADARKLMFETVKLTNQRGPLIAQQINQMDGTESIEALLGAARAAVAPPSMQISQEVSKDERPAEPIEG